MTITVEGLEPCFHQTVALGKDDQRREVFASACRTDGLVLTTVGADRSLGEIQNLTSKHLYPNLELDVVSLCALDLPGCDFDRSRRNLRQPRERTGFTVSFRENKHPQFSRIDF